MNKKIKNIMIGGLNKLLEDSHIKVDASYIKFCGNDDTETINQCLNEWEQAGLIKIIKPYDECEPEDICVKMLNFIDCGPPHDRFWENPHIIRMMNED
jgi:hypothetical protein